MGKANWQIEDVDYFAVNEAFASQVLACMRELNMNWAKTNANGWGISIGHPIGCTGGRTTYALGMEMNRKDLKKGLATLCIGGGIGFAITLERKEPIPPNLDPTQRSSLYGCPVGSMDEDRLQTKFLEPSLLA